MILPQLKRQTKIRLYPIIWRWHFFMGLLITPVLWIASITGALYVFRAELEPFIYPEMIVVEPHNELVPYSAQLAAVQATYPDYISHRMMVSSKPERPHKIYMFHPTREEIWVYVNQYTGEVLGDQSNSKGFFDIVIHIHQTLLAGNTGRLIVETATAWGIVTLISGLFLWWPRTKEKIWGVFLPRLCRSRKIFWRDLHAVPSILLLIISLLVMIASMNFTQFGKYPLQKAAEVTNQFPQLFFNPPLSEPAAARPPLALDEVVAIYMATRPTAELNIGLPLSETAAYEISAFTAINHRDFRVAYFDQYTGRTLLDQSWADVPPFGKLFFLFFPIHIGSIWGLPTKILAFAACLVLMWAPISGIVLWWRRRPNGSWLKAPPLPANPRITWLTVWVTISLGLLLPTVGVTVAGLLVLAIIGQMLKPAA